MKRLILSIGMCIAFFGASFGQSAGDLIITEIMADPSDVSDSNGEYFEIYNLTNDTLDLSGFKISDASNSHTITGTLKIAPKSFLVFVENGDSGTNGGVNGDYDYPSSITLNNTSETLSLSTGSDVVLTSISYTDGNPFGAGVAMELSNLIDVSSGVISEGDLVASTDDVDASGSDKGSPGNRGNTKLDATIISGDAGWRLLSLPKTGGYVEDVADDTPVQGIVDGADPSADANFYIYDNSGTWEKPTNDGASWGDGLGFALYFYNNTTNNSATLPLTLDVSGSEPSSQVDVTLNAAASGYTLVGNPFASNYNTNSMTATSSNISNNIAFWNDGTNSYSTQDRTANSGYIISPWQGFWVQTINAASTTLSFPTSGKTTSSVTGTFFSKSVNNRGDISFTLTSETTYDEAIRLAFRENATFGFDPDDFGKLPPLSSPYAIMAFESNEMLNSVESLPWNIEKEVNLSLQPQFVGVDGEFTFAWNGLETIPADWKIVLHDYEMEVSLDMREVSEYVFTDESDTQAKTNPLSLLTDPTSISLKSKTEQNRFGITISPASVNNERVETPIVFALDQNYPNPFNPSTTISYSIQNAGAVNISVYNLMGQKVATLVDENKSAGQYNVRWNASGVSSGMYYYRLETNGQSVTRKMTLIK